MGGLKLEPEDKALKMFNIDKDWFLFRLEFHPKLRMAPSEWKRLSFREVVQRHVILDKIDSLAPEPPKK